MGLKIDKKGYDFERAYNVNYMSKVGTAMKGELVYLKPERVGYSKLKSHIPKKLKGRSTSSKSVLFFSDMHVGNENSVCSENPSMKGGSYNPNELQKKLLETWYWVKDSVNQEPHIVCINGEPCDGPNPIEQGKQSWSTVFDEQLDDAYKLLKIYKPKHFVLTRGTNYHVQGGNQNMEERLAEKLNATPYSGYHAVEEIGIRTDYFLTFSLNGKVFSVTHHIGFNRWFAYRTTALAREMADMEFLKGKYWTPENTPSVIVRSHVHYFVMVRFAKTTGFTSPAWKLPDSHLFKGGLGGTAPSIGAVEVIVEPNGHIQVEPHILSDELYPKHNILDLT